MKVGIMIDELASGSAPKVIGQQVKGLAALGHKSEALVLKMGYDKTYDFHLSDVPICCLSDRYPSISRKLNMKFPGFSFFSPFHVVSPFFAPLVVREREWDVLVAHISYTCLTAKSLLKFRGIPYFAFIGTEPAYYLMPRIYSDTFLRHLMPVLVPLSVLFDKYVVEDCLAILTFSTYYRNLIRAYVDKALEVVHPGCFPVAKVKEEREDFIIAFDRWDVGNTPNIFLDILPRLSKEVGLVLAGHWFPKSLKTSFLQLASRKGLSGRVKVLGSLDEKAITDWCSRALVHVHPNKEAFGMQSLEAAACGCPTVIPEGSGVTEIFTNGIHGYFPRDRDVNSFADCIDRIVTSPERARRMGLEAWNVAKKNTWMEHAKRLAEMIEKYVAEHKKGGAPIN